MSYMERTKEKTQYGIKEEVDKGRREQRACVGSTNQYPTRPQLTV